VLVDREALQVDLLAKGVVDVAIDPRATFVLEARDKNMPVCIVAARRKTHAFILVGQKDIKSIQDLRGKTVDMGNPGGATDVMLRQVLKDHGIEPDKDVTFTYSGGPMHNLAAHIASFREGKDPAKLVTEKELEKLVAEGYPVLADLRKLYHSRHDRVTAANENFTREHPDLLKGCLKALIRACGFVLDMDREWFNALMRDSGFLTSKSELDSYDALFTAWEGRISKDLSLPRDGIDLIIEEQKKAGRISPSFNTEEVLRLDQLTKAQVELGI